MKTKTKAKTKTKTKAASSAKTKSTPARLVHKKKTFTSQPSTKREKRNYKERTGMWTGPNAQPVQFMFLATCAPRKCSECPFSIERISENTETPPDLDNADINDFVLFSRQCIFNPKCTRNCGCPIQVRTLKDLERVDAVLTSIDKYGDLDSQIDGTMAVTERRNMNK